MFKPLLTLLAALAVAAIPAAAMAHPKLLSSSPAQNATVSRPTSLTLTFSEVLVAPLSGIEITMTAMPGMTDHPPMPVKGFTTKVDGKTIVATLPRALPVGTYLLKWHVVAADQHRIEGSYTFKVK